MDKIILLKSDLNKKTRLVLLCSDDPHHYYLMEKMKFYFNVVGIVIESGSDQMQTLLAKKKNQLWRCRKYHYWRKKISGKANISKKYFKKNIDLNDPSLNILHAIDINHQSVELFLKELQPCLTICAGTMYVGSKVRLAANILINLHGGILPEYKGNQCIFFALYENNIDKIGATIHIVTNQLDGGSVISKVRPEILPSDNDETLYCKSFKLCVDKLIETITKYNNGQKIESYYQKKVNKKTYSHCDRNILVELIYLFKGLQRKSTIFKI